MIDRWTLRKWGRAAAGFALVCYALAEVLDRANQLAVRRAESAVEGHEFHEHSDE